ncbi:MAG: TlpA family protein disulfide reductase [Myxococcales bacterium]|nr:TlpA family protein disulfide reductase [Myxococcales bacterium]
MIKGGEVTVINLWGAWCEPCKRELPDLKRMFDRASWGDKVAFVSIHTPTEDPRAAHAEFAALMPSDKNFMIEIEAGSVSAALREDGAITKAGLPITLVLDCRREIRLPHVGELSSADFEELRPLIDQLVAELDTPFCVKATVAPVMKRKKPHPPGQTGATTGPAIGPTTGPAEPAGGCGDGRCDLESESCQSCAADCGCRADSTCKMKQEGGGYACIKNASALKMDD